MSFALAYVNDFQAAPTPQFSSSRSTATSSEIFLSNKSIISPNVHAGTQRLFFFAMKNNNEMQRDILRYYEIATPCINSYYRYCDATEYD